MANGRTPYLGSRGGAAGRTPYLGPSQATQAQPAAKPAKSGGGGGFFSRFASDLYNTAVHSPSGLYNLGKDVGVSTYDQFRHPLRVPNAQNDPLSKDIAAVGKGYKEDVQHPLRHPGNTFLDAVGALSLGAGTAARVAEVGRVAKAGEGAGEIARAVVKGPKPEARILKYNGEDIQAGQYSRSALRRSTERLRDKFSQQFPDVKLGRNLHQRVGHELAQNRRITEAIDKAPAVALSKVKLKPAEQKAIQVVAEGVPIKDRIAFHQKQLESFAPSMTKKIGATKKEIALLRSAEQHVHDVNGMPRINPGNHKLVNAFEMARDVARKREDILSGSQRLVRQEGRVVRTKALTAEGAENRVASPAAVIRGELGQTHYGFNPDLTPELFRFPYKAQKSISGIFRPQGYRGGIPQIPGSLSHSFEGALLKSGTFRNDTTKLIAESHLEAHRFAAVMKHRDQFLKLAHDAPLLDKNGHRLPNEIPIRTDALLNRSWPKVIQDISEKPALSKQDLAALNNHFEDLRSTLFPSVDQVERELAAGQHPNVKWINKDVLGGLNEPNPAVSGSTRRFVNVFDNINNASRAAILYLKPAYAVPNILGNAALNVVQQGWAAPAQVARTARVFYKLDKETRNKVKLAMGEGISGSLETERGIGARAINAMAHAWQKPVDTPFRLNAFFYEARRAGYKTPAQVKALFNDESKLLPIAREANKAIIDYGDLSPFEQSVIRRVIFFYPWVKGSTRYAGRYVSTHGTQASFLGQEGKIGAAQDQKDLGPVPSYAEGVFKVGQRGSNPLTLNPSSAGILQTPAQLGKALAELPSGHPGEAFTISQNMTPALAAMLALVGASQRRRNQSPLDAAKEQLVGGLPALTTVQGMMNPPANSARPRLYPRTSTDVLLHFLLGGLAPTPMNKAKAAQAKYLEDHPR